MAIVLRPTTVHDVEPIASSEYRRVVRLLFSFAGGHGHFEPMVPLARAAAAGGHEIAATGRADMLDAITARGFPAFESAGEWAAPDRTKRYPLVAYDPANEDRALREWYAGTLARHRAEAVFQVAARWRADVLVRDEADYGARVAAERLGIPHACVLVTIASELLGRQEVIGEPIAALRASHGLPVAPAPEPMLTPFPTSVREAPRAHAYRASDAPAADGDVVYLTLGTVFNAESGDLFGRALAGVREIGAPVVVSVGRQLDPSELGPQPAHVRVERWSELRELLPRCRAVVSHAGSGTVTNALAHGLPQVLLPIGADQPQTAARCAQLGAGRVLDPLTATPADVRNAVAEVIADPSYAAAAARVREELRALPDPAAALAAIGVAFEHG